jgi:hypothetical protein
MYTGGYASWLYLAVGKGGGGALCLSRGLSTRLSKVKKRNPRFSWGSWYMHVQ